MNALSRLMLLCLLIPTLLGTAPALAEDSSPAELPPLTLADVFQLEWASDPQVSPDGKTAAFLRGSMDIQHDNKRFGLWLMDLESGEARPVVTEGSVGSPRFSPDGSRLLYTRDDGDGKTQLFLRWLDGGETARITQLTRSPSSLTFSPDGRHIAFSMFVPSPPKTLPTMPAKPEGAEWADSPIYIDSMLYRSDSSGYLEPGYDHYFVVPAEGGTPRQLTHGDFDHSGTPTWLPDSSALVFSANRRPDGDLEPNDSELFEIRIADGKLRQLTDRRGPDNNPRISPDGRHIAYLGNDERYLGFQASELYILDRESGTSRHVHTGLDRDINNPTWSADGQSLFVQYSDHGNGKIARVGLDGSVKVMASDVGGLALGRPYSGGDFAVGGKDRIVFTLGQSDHPADLALLEPGKDVRRLTRLNEDLFSQRTLARVEEITFPSSYDGRTIQGWIAYPPGFDATKRYPLILEIHGGPFADYGDRFAMEIQLFASAGYVTLYINPRGSTSYGAEFANLIHHNYPSEDRDDLLSGVDAVIERGFVDPERLYVTGGSGGGVLTAWLVGHTDRFRAAVVAKPVIHWTSFVLTADAYNFFYRYWFPGPPWEGDNLEQYWKRSPLSRIGHVTTPTMLLTGEEDYRTPISESEQYYQALKLRGVDSAMVRIPGAAHGIANRPSHLMAKVAYILDWFARYGGEPQNSK